MNQTQLRKYGLECLGTIIFIYVILMSNNAWMIGLALAIVIYIAGPITGGHFNPAVSIMMLLRKQPDYGGAECVGYIIAQILGGICAYYFITRSLAVKSRKRK